MNTLRDSAVRARTRALFAAETADAAPCRASRRSSRAPCRRSHRHWACGRSRMPRTGRPSPRVRPAAHRSVRSPRRRIHALAVERDDGVRRIADQQEVASRTPGRAAHRDHVSRSDARRSPPRDPVSGAGVGEVRGRRSALTARGESSVAKLSAPSAGRNSVTVKLPSSIGQSDQHEAAARPDVQRVGVELMACAAHRLGSMSSL